MTLVFDETGRLLTNGTVRSSVAMLEGLHIDAIGINCGFGPRQMIPIVKQLTEASSLPIVVNPNAGLPRCTDGVTYYDIGPKNSVMLWKRLPLWA